MRSHGIAGFHQVSYGRVARALKHSRIVDALLEKDLELYDHVASAFKKLA
jgi:hypothetical protein